MPSDLSAILPLVGGFWVVLRCKALYLVSLQLGQAIAILLSAFVACVVALLSRALILLFIAAGWQSGLASFANALWPMPFSGTGLGAFALAFLIAELSAMSLKTKRITTWVVRNFADEMVKLLFDSMLRLKPVSLTLDTRKFYIGFVQEIPSLDPGKAFVRLLPILSGYRHERDLTFRFTTKYKEALASAENVDDFVMVIPLSTVKSANLFDRTAHGRFFERKEPPTVVVE